MTALISDLRDALLDLAPERVTVEDVDFTPDHLCEVICQGDEDCWQPGSCEVDVTWDDSWSIGTRRYCPGHVVKAVDDELGAGASRVHVAMGRS